jgi:predicted dehydrogenase
MTRHASRRDFLKAGALSGFGYWALGGVSAQETTRRPGPNDRLNIGIIGAGGQGGGNLRNVARTENIVALCDVDDRRAADAYRDFPRATRYHDFRQMLDRERGLDAVVVSTPDHQHAIASITAMRMGKHCYTEKPLTHDVWEARRMGEVARERRVATQMGNQGTSNSTLREAVEVVRAGGIGDVREVHVWTDRPGNYWRQGLTRPAESPAVPNGLNWDLWLGTAPRRPYNPAYVPFAWRGWWDFGTGALGDMACHTMNLPYLALRLGAPAAIAAVTDQPVNNECPPNGLMVTYEFPARRAPGQGNQPGPELPAVRLMWYEVRRPPRELFHGRQIPGSGSIMVGSRGSLYSPSDYGGSYELLPQDQFRDYRRPERTLPRSPGHHAEWIRACKGGPAAMSNFTDHAGPLTEAVLLGNVAIRAGARIVWDSAQLRVTNNREANQYIRREYRTGWTI